MRWWWGWEVVGGGSHCTENQSKVACSYFVLLFCYQSILCDKSTLVVQTFSITSYNSIPRVTVRDGRSKVVFYGW